MKWRGMYLLALGILSGAANSLELEGRVNWSQRTELGTLVSGVVDAVPVRQGQYVKEGDELLRLDDRDFKARIAEAQAQVSGAGARHTEAKREDERAEELYDRTVLSDHERQLAAIAFQESASTLLAARARLTRARIDYERSVIKAPYDAIVVRVDTSPGEIIVSELQSKPLLVVAQAQLMTIEGLASAPQMAQLEPGMTAQVEIRDALLQGTVSSLGLEPVASEPSGTLYHLKVSVEVPPDMGVRVGEAAMIRVGE